MNWISQEIRKKVGQYPGKIYQRAWAWKWRSVSRLLSLFGENQNWDDEDNEIISPLFVIQQEMQDICRGRIYYTRKPKKNPFKR